MRKQKSTVTLLALALVLAFGAVPVMAAEDTVPPTIPTVYPIEVHSSESGGIYRLEKVYCLGTKDDPAAIPTQSFEREGRHYELLDLLKAGQTETDTQEHIEIITLESSTKDMSEIIKVRGASGITSAPWYWNSLCFKTSSASLPMSKRTRMSLRGLSCETRPQRKRQSKCRPDVF